MYFLLMCSNIGVATVVLQHGRFIAIFVKVIFRSAFLLEDQRLKNLPSGPLFPTTRTTNGPVSQKGASEVTV